MDPYYLIIALSVFVILSYIYGEFAKRTNIPAVLLLIITGVVLNLFLEKTGIVLPDLFPYLELLGIIGLIMIVMEGALDLELTREKLPLILKSSTMALIGIIGSMAIIAPLLRYFFEMDWPTALLYSTPLAVISSAIVLPSVSSLPEEEKEFLIYESTMSDIFGIMAFYLMTSFIEKSHLPTQANPLGASLSEFATMGALTVVVSVLISILLIILFKFVKTDVKLFLFIAILILMYALGKKFHLSSLILILVFGLILKNHHLIFKGPLKNIIKRMEFKLMERNFHIITRETAFILRTFFFIVFGMTITLSQLVDIKVFIISAGVVAFIFLVRWLLKKAFASKMANVINFIAPRGLITILLFYSIPKELSSESFEPGILLWVVIISSLIMTWGLIKRPGLTPPVTAKVSTIENPPITPEQELPNSDLE